MEQEKFFQPKPRPDVLDPEFLAQIRKEIAERLETGYRILKEMDPALPEKVKAGETKFYINGMVGDAFAHVAGEKHRLNEEEIEKLRKILFLD